MELNKESFTIDEVKGILYSAFEDEKDVHKGAVKFMPITIVEWYKSDIFKEQLTLKKTVGGKMREMTRSINCSGTYFPMQRTIGCFIHGIGKLKKIHTIADSLDTLYHELIHEYQHVLRRNVKGWSNFDFWFWKNDIEEFVQSYSPNHYSNHHDEYYFEIEANLEGVNKGIQYCEKKGILPDRLRKWFQKRKNRYLYDLNNYDFHSFLHQMHKIVTKNSKIDAKTMVDDFVLRWLYNSDKSFKTVGEILAMANIIHIDETFLNYFFSSKDFLNSVDFSSLSLEHQQVIMRALQSVYNLDLEKRNKNNLFLNVGSISRGEWLSANIKISGRLSFLTRKLEELKKGMALSNINENQEDLKRQR